MGLRLHLHVLRILQVDIGLLDRTQGVLAMLRVETDRHILKCLLGGFLHFRWNNPQIRDDSRPNEMVVTLLLLVVRRGHPRGVAHCFPRAALVNSETQWQGRRA